MTKRKPVVIECYAYLPPIQSAIMVSGDGDLLQAKFNINLSISPEAAKLLVLTGKKLKLTVEETVEPKQVDNVREEEKPRRRSRNSIYNKAD